MNYCPGVRSEQTATRDLMNLRVATATTLAIFFIQNHDVRKRPDNQRLLPSAADSGTRAALRASRFALRRCRSALSACFRRSVCRDIRALVSGIVSREEGYTQGGSWRAAGLWFRRQQESRHRAHFSGIM